MPAHSDVLNDSSGDKVVESRQRNQHLENYFAYVADAIMVTDINGRVMDLNPATCRLLGYSRDELLTMHLWDFVINASRSEILDLLCHLRHGVPATVQRTCCNRDGEHLVIDLRLTRFVSAGRDLMIIACHDVTETRRLEAQLRKSEHNLAEGQRLTKTGSWVLDPKTGETDWSIGICRIFGFPDPPPSPHYSEFRARVHEDDRAAVDQLTIETFKTGKPRLLQYLYVLPDGTVKNIETVAQPVFDDNGNVVRLMGTVMDVTERHKAEAKLRASERLARGQMQALVKTLDAMAQESAPDKNLEHVLSTITEQFEVDSISEWHRDLSSGSWSAESLSQCLPLQREFDANQQAREFVMPLQDCPLWAEISRIKKPVVCEDIAQYPQIPFQERLLAQGVVTVLSVPLLIGGEVGGIIGLRFNHKRTFHPEEVELAQALAHQATLAIQLMRQSEHSRQAAVEAERNRFARDVHDTLAQGFTGVVVQLEAAEDAITKGLSREADDHIARAGELARYGLSEARRSVGALRPQMLEENELAAALQNLIKKMSDGTGLEAEFTLQGQPHPLPPDWDGHLMRISQESLTNTLRHANATSFLARLTFSPDGIHLELRDNGSGFDPHQKCQGFGLLGLKERVAEMDGELEINSAPGQGTVIFVHLPLVKDISDGAESNLYDHIA